MVSKCPALLGVLNWVEEQDHKEVTAAMWNELQRGNYFMTEFSVNRLSEMVWGFLNTCLKGDAHATFEGAELLNGLDGWRLVVQDIQRGRTVRRASLRKLVKNPPAVTKLEDVVAGMARYQNLLREYRSVGGTCPEAQEQT